MKDFKKEIEGVIASFILEQKGMSDCSKSILEHFIHLIEEEASLILAKPIRKDDKLTMKNRGYNEGIESLSLRLIEAVKGGK